MASKAVVAVGVGAGLVGAFFVFREIQKYQARKRLQEMAAAAAAGQIPTRQFLDAALAAGQPTPLPGQPRITIEDAKRLPCSQVFNFPSNAFPGFEQELAELRRQGTCL